ncbi:hypothetical protein FISHEDRAFT_68133 [Fistulina hepatica ATCC 64428]|uniref:Dipeptidase n=1 Tax=Fistulina hepatica ATCC 64428 TaxID=1128425 RepID=A0A0D7A1K4_9AGAR|nr:hypothetical protein FISHEDRAFT_68133 [Fistulina hepatica ATCC 64428]
MEHNHTSSEQAPLLRHDGAPLKPKGSSSRTRAIRWMLLTALALGGMTFILAFHCVNDPIRAWLGIMPEDPALAAEIILKKAPVIDGHIDLPILTRVIYRNNVSNIDLEETIPGHVDIPRLRKGRVGGFFWSVYTECPDPEVEGPDYVDPTYSVRDTLEQIDISKLLMEKHSDTFALALSAADVRKAIRDGKIAGLLGVEGAHQLGASIPVLRQYQALGVRYVTLTHTCHNPFADSCGTSFDTVPRWGGVSPLGIELISELNRLGIFVDLSHVSDNTMRQAIKLTKAPVIWSHSSARSIHNVPRNVPDDVLEMVGLEPGKVDGIVMVNFFPNFVAPPGEATVDVVADHVEHIAKITGKKQYAPIHRFISSRSPSSVGLGSDFDGIPSVPEGLEDVSKYPALIAKLYSRGWTKHELAGLTSGNLLRVMEGMEAVAKQMQAAGVAPATGIYDKRTDI